MTTMKLVAILLPLLALSHSALACGAVGLALGIWGIHSQNKNCQETSVGKTPLDTDTLPSNPDTTQADNAISAVTVEVPEQQQYGVFVPVPNAIIPIEYFKSTISGPGGGSGKQTGVGSAK